MLLQGEQGYYAEEYELEGSKFRLRELTDEELTEALADEAEQQAAVDAIPPEERSAHGMELITRARAGIDRVTRAGVVGWDLREECTPGNVVRLPLRVRQLLAKRIGQISALQADEAPFSAR